jgi:hypothetical protein
MRLEPADLESLRPMLREFAAEIVAEVLSRSQPASSDQSTIRLAYSESEAAAMLGLEQHVLREQRRLGRIEFCRGPGRRILYRRDQIDAYLRRAG